MDDSSHPGPSKPGSIDLVQSRQPTPLTTSHDQTRPGSVSSEGTLTPKEGSFDFGKVLRTVLKRSDEANISRRELGVVFEDLRVVGLGATVSYQPTLGSLFSPRAILEGIQDIRHPPVRDILSGFEGVIKPGEMILVLGSPGSGCSTFLKTLANHRSEYHAIEGRVDYDSISHQELGKRYRGDVQYIPEDDIHFPTLTVGQTLDFAAKTRAPQHRLIDQSREEYREAIVGALMTVFGLSHTRKTPVGDAAVRGVSGGEKKRVSIAEALATRPLIGAWDNSTRGLDASTALEFVQALRQITDNLRTTTIVSIYQAGELLYKQFDKVCVIYEGKMAYFGPANKARQYFIDMGYEPANRQTTADFLVAVTDPLARIPRDGISNQPRSAAEFAQHFKSSSLGVNNRKEIEAYRAERVGKPELAAAFKQSAQSEKSNHHRMNSAYTVSIPMQIKAVMLRRVQILLGSWILTAINLFSYIFQAIIMATVFIRAPQATSAYFSRGGVLFFALLFAALTAMAEIPALYAQRPIVVRHQKSAMYHPFIEAAALTLVDIPIMFGILAVFCLIIYFGVRLQQTAEQFFVFFLFIFVVAIVMKSWFRMLAAALAAEASAQTFAGISILAFSLYTGYSIPKPSMIGALRWITYINPLRFGFEAVLTNEFRTLQGRCSTLAPSGPGYEDVTIVNQVCTTPGSLPGQSVVDGNRFVDISFGFSYSNTWMNFGIVCAFGVGFIALLLGFTEYNTVAGTHNAAVTRFKRGSKAQIVQEAAKEASDEEKVSEPSAAIDERAELEKKDMEKAAAQAPAMSDIFTWQNVQYTVPISGEADRKLLDDVSGFVAPGKLTALMGESGAGKTTLLNVLAQRVRTGVVTGDKFVNGHGLPKDFQAQTGYCQQMDTHEPTSTVREALLFSANLRQPSNVPREEKEAYVETCLKMCGLEKYADATVGSLDIEYRKRTTIGVELAAKPRLLLFLDEPTSGLDSQSAWAIMAFLRSLADKGQAILCTIHQPSAELFQVFDRLLLLRKGGQTVYFGDLGHYSTTLLNYFESNGARHCEEDENPAEYMLDVIGAGATATSTIDWHSTWKSSPEASGLQNEINRIHDEGRKRAAVSEALHSEHATSWFTQLWELFKRDAAAHWRDPDYLMAKLVLNIVGGLFIGFTFFLAKDSQQGTQNKLFAIFMGTILSVPLSNQLQVPFINMRNIYEIRERPSRMYSWTALVTSQILIELPWNILGSTLFFFTFYWTVGFESSRAGYTYLSLAIIFPLYYTTIGQAVAAMSPNAEIAAILFSFLFSFVITFNGVLQPFRELGWYKWLYRVSPYTYLIEGLLGNAIGRQEINCSPVEFVTVQPPSGQTCAQYMDPFISTMGGYLSNPNASSDCSLCAFRTTDQYLFASFNIVYDHRWRNVGLMFVFIAFNIFATFVLTYLFRIRTGSLLPSFKKRSSK